MSGPRETLIVETSGAAAGALTPGLVQRMLGVAAGVAAEEIGAMSPLGRGRVAVDIDVLRSERLATPRPLAVLSSSQGPLLTLRRDSDPPAEQLADVQVTWRAPSAAPGVGALGRALSLASDGALGAEDLGAAFVGANWMTLRLPECAWFTLKLPAELSLGDGQPRVTLTWARAAGTGT